MKRCMLALGIVLLLLSSAWGSGNDTLHYAGTLKDSEGLPINDGRNLTFRLFDHETDGTSDAALWSETLGVQVENGFFNVPLGAVTAFTEGLFDHADLWLEIEVCEDGGRETCEILSPRQPLRSVPWAQKAASVEGLVKASSVMVGETEVIDNTGKWVGDAAGFAGENGADGIHCWDLNGNGACDTASEDFNDSGTCTTEDCQGLDGEDGTDGFSCWDLNQNYLCDGAEDTDGQNGCTVLDCQNVSGGGVASDLACSGCVDSSDVAFNYAGSDSKGGAATSALTASSASDLACSGCVGESEVSFNICLSDETGKASGALSADAATVAYGLECTDCVDNTDVAFNYAGSDSQGGVATSALTASSASDLACSGCVEESEVSFNICLADEAGKASGALSADASTVAYDLECSGCVDETELAVAFLKKPGNLVTVAQSGGDFSDIQAAIDSITDASETNPYVVYVAPGYYDLGAGYIDMKSHVHLKGAGRDATFITSSASGGWDNNHPTLLIEVSHTSISGLTIENTATGVICTTVQIIGDTLENIRLFDSKILASSVYEGSVELITALDARSEYELDNLIVVAENGLGLYIASNSNGTIKNCHIESQADDKDAIYGEGSWGRWTLTGRNLNVVGRSYIRLGDADLADSRFFQRGSNRNPSTFYALGANVTGRNLKIIRERGDATNVINALRSYESTVTLSNSNLSVSGEGGENRTVYSWVDSSVKLYNSRLETSGDGSLYTAKTESNGTIFLRHSHLSGGDTSGNVTTSLCTVEGQSEPSTTDLLTRLENLENQYCPPGYDKIDDADVLATGYYCRKEVSTGVYDEMVKVGDFWVDRYESTIYENADCTGTKYGTTVNDAHVAGFYRNGMDDPSGDSPGLPYKRLYACSMEGVEPSRWITWFQAAEACAASGKHLITDWQWQVAASGTPDPHDADPEDDSELCNIWENSKPSGSTWGTTNETILTGSASQCISRYGAYDMVGNLWEWTANWQGGPEDASNSLTQGGDEYHGDGTWNVKIAEYQGTNASSNVFPAVSSKGGGWSGGSRSGVFVISLNSSPSSWNDNSGFRCAVK